MRCGLEQVMHQVYSARDLRSVRNPLRSATKAGSGEFEDLTGGLFSAAKPGVIF